MVGVREGEWVSFGLVARGIAGEVGGEPKPRGRWLALAAALLEELTPYPRGDGEQGANRSGDLVASLDLCGVGVSGGGGERDASSRECK